LSGNFNIYGALHVSASFIGMDRQSAWCLLGRLLWKRQVPFVLC